MVISLWFIVFAAQQSKPRQPKVDSKLTMNGGNSNNKKTVEIFFHANQSTKFSQSGQAILIEQNGRLTLSLDLSTIPLRKPQPAYIQYGSCLTPKKILYSLSDVVAGLSETDLDINLDQLKSKRPLSIDIRKSYDEIKVQTACANL